MAKRRSGGFKRIRRVASRGFKSVKRYNRTSAGLKPTDLIIGGAIYGVGRRYLAQLLSPVSNAIQPYIGSVSDNVILGLADYAGMEYLGKKSRIVKAAFAVGLGTEAAQTTQELMSGTSFSSNSTSIKMYG